MRHGTGQSHSSEVLCLAHPFPTAMSATRQRTIFSTSTTFSTGFAISFTSSTGLGTPTVLGTSTTFSRVAGLVDTGTATTGVASVALTGTAGTTGTALVETTGTFFTAPSAILVEVVAPATGTPETTGAVDLVKAMVGVGTKEAQERMALGRKGTGW